MLNSDCISPEYDCVLCFECAGGIGSWPIKVRSWMARFYLLVIRMWSWMAWFWVRWLLFFEKNSACKLFLWFVGFFFMVANFFYHQNRGVEIVGLKMAGFIQYHQHSEISVCCSPTFMVAYERQLLKVIFGLWNFSSSLDYSHIPTSSFSFPSFFNSLHFVLSGVFALATNTWMYRSQRTYTLSLLRVDCV